jgi:hypothetical protein
VDMSVDKGGQNSPASKQTNYLAEVNPKLLHLTSAFSIDSPDGVLRSVVSNGSGSIWSEG